MESKKQNSNNELKNNNNNNIKNKIKSKISTDIEEENPEDENMDIKINTRKNHTIYAPSSRTTSFSLDYNIKGFSKILREDKKPTKKSEQQKPKKIINLKSLKDQWSFQKILLDYNILDFTSKFNFYYF